MNDETFIKTSPLRRTPISSAPTTVPKMLPTPAEKRRAADHNRGDHVQFQPKPRDRLGRAQPCRKQECRQPAANPTMT